LGCKWSRRYNKGDHGILNVRSQGDTYEVLLWLRRELNSALDAFLCSQDMVRFKVPAQVCGAP
jgi:hypothetical protein